jgi:hypothetical protein
MISYEVVAEFPLELLACTNVFANSTPQPVSLASLIALSFDNRYIKDDETPLLFVGAFRPTFFSPYTELWMYGTQHLKARHAREFRDAFYEWTDAQTVAVRARVNNSKAARFLRFMGFRKIEAQDGIELYEVRP